MGRQSFVAEELRLFEKGDVRYLAVPLPEV